VRQRLEELGRLIRRQGDELMALDFGKSLLECVGGISGNDLLLDRSRQGSVKDPEDMSSCLRRKPPSLPSRRPSTAQAL
jgi:hypothetical protein